MVMTWGHYLNSILKDTSYTLSFFIGAALNHPALPTGHTDTKTFMCLNLIGRGKWKGMCSDDENEVHQMLPTHMFLCLLKCTLAHVLWSILWASKGQKTQLI